MHSLSPFLMRHEGAIVASYVVLSRLGAYIWWRTENYALEIALFLVSLVAMPVIYLAMFEGSVLITSIFAPQFPLLVFFACCSVWSLFRRDPPAIIAIAFSFPINVAGGVWTYFVLTTPMPDL